jgi:hypothetical protein
VQQADPAYVRADRGRITIIVVALPDMLARRGIRRLDAVDIHGGLPVAV